MIELSTDFECGNGQNIRRLSEGFYALDVRADPGYCYYFCVRLANQGSFARIRLNVYPDPDLAQKELSSWPSDKAAVVWVRRGAIWHALPDAPFTDTDTAQVGNDGYRISLSIGAGETVDISNVVVIPYSEMSQWLAHVAGEAGPLAHLQTIGESAQGRAIHCLTITDPSLPAVDKQRILILAGEHATEYAGQWAVRGIVDYLLSTVRQAHQIRENYVVDVLPQVNPDGNVLGRPQLTAEGHDVYSGYLHAAAGTMPVAPECRAVWQWAHDHVPDLLLNFHGYVGPRNHGDAPYHGIYVPPLDSYKAATARARQQQVMDYLRFETDGLSQHLQFIWSGPETLNYQLANQYGVVGCLYEPNMVGGRHGSMQTGVRVLRALLTAVSGIGR